MQFFRSILGCIREGDLLITVDLKEAYLHVPIHPAYHKLLSFTYASRHFHFPAMPFSLSSAPRTFTKLLVTVAATVCLVPVCILCYLDDILILSSTRAQAIKDLETISHILQSHGFSFELGKESSVTYHLHIPSWGGDRLAQRSGLPVPGLSNQHQGVGVTSCLTQVGSLAASV